MCFDHVVKVVGGVTLKVHWLDFRAVLVRRPVRVQPRTAEVLRHKLVARDLVHVAVQALAKQAT